MKFTTNLQHVSGHCCKGYLGWRSKVNVLMGLNAMMWWIHFDSVVSRLTC